MKPILFSTPMVQAILEGRKTQTRRVITPEPGTHNNDGTIISNVPPCGFLHWINKAPYQPDDILWVRETWQRCRDDEFCYFVDELINNVTYIDEDDEPLKWKPSIHMPRAAARIFLRVTDVRVERLQDISIEDCYSEGISIEKHECGCPVQEITTYKKLWDSINAKRGYGWDTNPWVWVYEFEKVGR